MTETAETARPDTGEWVQVWGQVMEGKVHPEDVLVEFFSHSEQYTAHVRADRVRITAEQPDFVTTCTAMFEFAGRPNGFFVRCARHEQHGGDHRDPAGTTHTEDEVVGYFEEKF